MQGRVEEKLPNSTCHKYRSSASPRVFIREEVVRAPPGTKDNSFSQLERRTVLEGTLLEAQACYNQRRNCFIFGLFSNGVSFKAKFQYTNFVLQWWKREIWTSSGSNFLNVFSLELFQHEPSVEKYKRSMDEFSKQSDAFFQFFNDTLIIVSI